ncbi:hypothetical protein WN943_010418 [Citrus x changshan-huyou]
MAFLFVDYLLDVFVKNPAAAIRILALRTPSNNEEQAGDGGAVAIVSRNTVMASSDDDAIEGWCWSR